MAVKKLMETTLPEIYQRVADEEANQIIDASRTSMIADVAFTAVSNCLSSMKLKEKPMAFVFEELNGNFNAGAVVKYQDGGNDSGDNWSYVWTFNREDIPEDAKVIKMTDIPAHQYFNAVSGQKYHFSLKDFCIADAYSKFFKVLSSWLDENATADETTSIVLDGVFEARVDVDGEEIIKSLEPSGEIKTLIKSDAAIEK